MNRDNALIMEALHDYHAYQNRPGNADRIISGMNSNFITSELHKVHTKLNQLSTMIHLNRSAETDQLLSKIRDMSEMLMTDAPAENAEDEPHGYPQGMTAIQNLLLNELKKYGFELTRISHADKERDKYPTVFMHNKSGPMHRVVEIDGMGAINGEPYKKYLANLKEKIKRLSGIRPEDPEDPYYDTWQSIAQDHAGEDAEGYNAMDHLAKAANQIRDILNSNADDEARTEHIINMAQLILGDKKDYTEAEYRKMLDGLIVLLNRFIVVPMN